MAKKRNPDPFAPKVRQDPVTGRTEREANGPVEQAAQRAGNAVESMCLALPTDAPSAVRYAIVERASGYLHALGCVGTLEWPEHVAAAVRPEPYAAVRREWDGLDAAGRHWFAELLRARLAAMLPHSPGYGVGPKVKPNSEAA